MTGGSGGKGEERGRRGKRGEGGRKGRKRRRRGEVEEGGEEGEEEGSMTLEDSAMDLMSQSSKRERRSLLAQLTGVCVCYMLHYRHFWRCY